MLTRTTYGLRGLTGQPPVLTQPQIAAAVAAVVVTSGGRLPKEHRQTVKLLRDLRIAGNVESHALTIRALTDNPEWPRRALDPALIEPASRGGRKRRGIFE